MPAPHTSTGDLNTLIQAYVSTLSKKDADAYYQYKEAQRLKRKKTQAKRCLSEDEMRHQEERQDDIRSVRALGGNARDDSD